MGAGAGPVLPLGGAGLEPEHLTLRAVVQAAGGRAQLSWPWGPHSERLPLWPRAVGGTEQGGTGMEKGDGTEGGRGGADSCGGIWPRKGKARHARQARVRSLLTRK